MILLTIYIQVAKNWGKWPCIVIANYTYIVGILAVLIHRSVPWLKNLAIQFMLCVMQDFLN